MAIKTLSSSPGGSDDHEGGEGIVAEINIVPLTDIFLVLLIIFMVTSSVISQMGVDVKLPVTTQGSSESQPEGVIVTLLPNGKLRVNQEAVPGAGQERLKNLNQMVRRAFEKTKSRVVILEGDRQAFLGSAIEVMDQARAAGADRFAIATTEKR